MRNVQLHASGVSPQVRDAIADSLRESVSERQGDWQGSISEDAENNAWDVEVHGPNHFYWSRRFSGADRDPAVISAAVNLAITTDPRVA